MSRGFESTFDQEAIDYDSNFSDTLIGKAQRKIVHDLLRKSISGKKMSVLEINCGTGEDAHFISRLGHNVIATDVSTTMIELSEKKFATDNSIHFQVCSFSQLKEKFYDKKFDLIFSNFGGLNCIPPNEIKIFSADASSLLTENGQLIVVTMPEFCLWETFYFVLKFQFHQAFRRRKKNGVAVRLKGAQQKTWYYSPQRFSHLLESNFSLNNNKPVGIFIPPSYLNSFFVQRQRLFSLLEKMENMFSFSIFASLSDHCYMQFRKNK